jgi:hypothetical protein
MQKLSEVESAKALMTEAMSWSVMKWLREKKRVRHAADKANAALDTLNCAVKEQWTKADQTGYESRLAQSSNGIFGENAARLLAHVKEADEKARNARMDAEAMFAKAEKQLSIRLAREGCRMAIHSWELQEQAIRRAVQLIRVQEPDRH